MWQTLIYDFITYAIFTYSVIQLLFYIFIGSFSVGAYRKYKNKNSFIDYKLLAVSPYAPSISILAPAYNEEANIIENVRSLLSIYYNNMEVIIINDGSKDNGLQQLISAYNLVKVDHFVSYQIQTKPVRGVYKSKNPIYKKLVVVDKVNGGKADALNVGINIASNDYIVCIDVDCVLEQDALLKLMKPFLEITDKKVIATGGVVRIANSCDIQFGRLLKINLPKEYLPRMQTLEYIRAFLLGRMAWSRINGLMLISGAFGAFDKEIAIKVGGYNHKTVGEDMELVVRMRRYMEELKQPYKVAFIPDPLCWTEAPVNFKILGRQRNRWTRGTIETLGIHKKMFCNPRYHILGMLSFPYWFFFEMCAPGVEFLGMVAFLLMAMFKMIYWQTFFAFLVFIITFGYLYSAFAIYMEVNTYNQYKRKSDVMKLLLTALTEPFVFHPFVVWSGVKGYLDKIQNKSSWGEMTRTGLKGKTQTAIVTEPVVVEEMPIEEIPSVQIPIIPTPVIQKQHSGLQRWKDSMQEVAIYNLLLIAGMLFIKAFEIIRDVQLHGIPKFLSNVVLYGFANELSFVLNIALLPSLIFTLIYLLQKNIARSFFIVFSVMLVLVHAALIEYFLETLVPLGGDFWLYSFAEIIQTFTAGGGTSHTVIFSTLLMLTGLLALFISIPQKIRISKRLSFALFALFNMGGLYSIASGTNNLRPGQEYSNNISLNKSYYFYSSSLQRLIDNEDEDLLTIVNNNTSDFNYPEEENYPFMHTVDTSANVLAPFFNTTRAKPNLVFIAVEGLGRAFSNKDAYLGSFTPFLDSLSEKSLYWSNFLSAGGRTFALLPSVFGSLPYQKNGFADEGDRMPRHSTLLSILKQQGYKTNFFYGGDASFDNMSIFLKMNGTTVYDKSSFSSKYKTMPANAKNFSWGYGDEEVFRKYNEVTATETEPSCNVVLTLSTHNPFKVQPQEHFLELFEQRMQSLGYTETQKEEHRLYKNQFATILYTDNAIQNFIKNYSTRPDFSNTIFIITGDHRMPEIPMVTEIDRYHVPFIIYSPMLKQGKNFASVSSHLDITPSLLAFLGHQNQFPIPDRATWLGSGLDTASNFRNIHAYPLMANKNNIGTFIMNDYFLNGSNVFKISNNMNLDPVENEIEKKKLQNGLAIFKHKNNRLIKGAPLLPQQLLVQKEEYKPIASTNNVKTVRYLK